MFLKDKIKNNKFILGIKVAVCGLIICLFCVNLFGNFGDKYYKTHNCDTVFSSPENVVYVSLQKGVNAGFTSYGNQLNNIDFYLKSEENPSGKMEITISDENNKIIEKKNVSLSDFSAEGPSTVSVDANLKKDKNYKITFLSKDAENVSIAVPTSTVNKSETMDEDELNNINIGTESFILHFSYKYLEGAYALQFLTDFLCSISLIFILCDGVMKFENGLSLLKAGLSKSTFVSSLFFSLICVLNYNPMDSDHTKVRSFSRVFGNGFISDYDVTRVIRNFSAWFLLFGISLFLFLIAFSYLLNDKGKNTKAFKTYDNTVLIALTCFGFSMITFFADKGSSTDVFHYAVYLITLIVLLNLFYIISPINRFIQFNRYEELITFSLSVAFPVTVILGHEWESGRFLIGMQAITALCMIICYLFIPEKWKDKEEIGNAFNWLTVICASSPLLTSLYIEGINVLNQHQIFIARPRHFYVIACMLGAVIWMLLSVVFRKKKINWEKVTYPLLVLGIGFISVQLPLQGEYYPDIFESANNGVLISDFLNYGDIPIVQHYGGHMMSSVWEGILYGLINHDKAGAIYSPYSVYITPIILLLLFIFLKYFIEPDSAFLATIILPFAGTISYWGLGFLICIAAIAYCKKNTYARAYLLWISCIWCALYRLDLGYAFIIGVLVAFIIQIIFSHNKLMLKQLLVSGLVSVGITGLLWCVLCVLKDINPVIRLKEFIQISASNNNWAYGNIGDTTQLKYAWHYIVMPFTVVICLVWVIFSQKFKKKFSMVEFITILILGFAYFGNYARGLVRHSLAENADYIVWTSYLFLTLVVTVYHKDRKILLPLFSVFIVLNSFFFNPSNFSEMANIETSASTIGNTTDTWRHSRFDSEEKEQPKLIWQKLDENRKRVKRVKQKTDSKLEFAPYKDIVNTLLDKDDTLVDFENSSFIYSAFNKEDPVYVAQSPGHLSGDFTQEQFIAEVEKNKEHTPLALMPYTNGSIHIALDGIANVYRYYRVSEYIYQNYRPLCTADGVAVWVRKERFNEFEKKLPELTDEMNNLKADNGADLNAQNCKAEIVPDGIQFVATGGGAEIADLQNVLTYDHSGKTGRIAISVSYKTNTGGNLQLYYTTDEGEDYSDDKSNIRSIGAGEGNETFIVPVSKYTKLRLAFPDHADFTITEFKVGSELMPIAYGYDGPDYSGGTKNYGNTHQYNLEQLPYLWAKYDKENSADNKILENVKSAKDMYLFSDLSESEKKKGNYLLISADYTGTDDESHPKDDDETADAVIKLGNNVAGDFNEKCTFNFKWKEGLHQYLIRVSSDYYWYSGSLDALTISPAEGLSNISVKVLAGD